MRDALSGDVLEAAYGSIGIHGAAGDDRCSYRRDDDGPTKPMNELVAKGVESKPSFAK